MYEGLGSDNRLVRVNAMHVVGWQEGEAGGMAPDLVADVEAALTKAVVWSRLAGTAGVVVDLWWVFLAMTIT